MIDFNGKIVRLIGLHNMLDQKNTKYLISF